MQSKPSSSRKAPTLKSAFDLWMESTEFGLLSASTQASYRYIKQYVSAHTKITALDHQSIEKIIAPLRGRPGLYSRARSHILRVCSFAVSQGWRNDTPRHNATAPALGVIDRWSKEQVLKALEKTARNDLRYAIAGVYYTAQRLVDVVKLRPMDRVSICGEDGVRRWHFRVVQQKTGAEVFPEITAELERWLPPAGHTERYTFSNERALRQAWARQRASLGPEFAKLTLHGPRKSASCEAAEGGASMVELQAYLGHRSIQTAERYFRQADKAKLASGAMRARRAIG